jgi:hypothetical protein
MLSCEPNTDDYVTYDGLIIIFKRQFNSVLRHALLVYAARSYQTDI